MLKKVFLGIFFLMFMSCCPVLADEQAYAPPAPAAPGGVKITAIDGEPVTSEECQVSSPDGLSGWLPRQTAEDLLKTLKQQNPDAELQMTCRYE
jgi:hypothetical protein